MKTRIALVAVMSSLVVTAVARSEQTVPSDKLPPGAIARLQQTVLAFSLNDDGMFAMSPDGKTIAANIRYSSQLPGVAVHDLATGRTIALESSNETRPREMSALAFSPDGKTLAGGNGDGDVIWWNVATGKLRLLLTDEERIERLAAVRSLAFSPDGKYLAVGRDSTRYIPHHHGLGDTKGPNNTIIVRDAETGEKLREIAAQTGGVSALAFAPDGTLWSGGRAWERADKRIRHWDVQSGQEISWAAFGLLNYIRFISWSDVVNTLAVSTDGQMVADSIGREDVRVWNIASGREIQRLPGHGAWFGADRSTLVVAYESEVRFWDLSARKLLRSETADSTWVRSAAVLPSREVVAHGLHSGMFVLEPSGAKRALQLTGQADAPIPSKRIDWLAFSADGSVLASVGPDTRAGYGGDLHLWDAATGKERPVSEGLGGKDVSYAAFSADGTRLATTAHSSEAVSIWDALGASALHKIDLKQRAELLWPTRLSFSPDGVWLATGMNRKGVINLFNASNGAFVRAFAVPRELDNPVRAFAFSPDSRSLVLAGVNVTRSQRVSPRGGITQVTNMTMRVSAWETATGKQLSMVDIPETGVFALSPNGMLTIGALGREIVVREVANGEQSQVIPNPGINLRVAIFSPDSRFVALGGEYGEVRVWDLRSGSEIQRFIAHAASVSALAFAPDNSKLASAAEDGSALVWRVNRTK